MGPLYSWGPWATAQHDHALRRHCTLHSVIPNPLNIQQLLAIGVRNSMIN